MRDIPRTQINMFSKEYVYKQILKIQLDIVFARIADPGHF
jgi:hypothetical protein